jgi:uncharacterized membrane protein
MKPVSRAFFKGLIAIIPLTLTLYLLVWLAATAEFALGNIFKLFLPQNWYIKGVCVMPHNSIFFGNFLESRALLKLFNNFEHLMFQIPIVKSIYSAIRDFTALFSSEQKRKFEQVVLVMSLTGKASRTIFCKIWFFS